MSEYQYYEFVAVDRPLTSEQMAELRRTSTRADISSTRFANEYNWSDLAGNPDRMTERYFDAHLYYTNWGTRRLMFRLPASALDLGTAQQYCGARSHGNHVLVDFRADDEDGEIEYDEGPPSLSSLISARAELLSGDRRLLYLAWLLGIQDYDPEWSELDLDGLEPPVPPGLDALSGPQQAFVGLFGLDEYLLDAALRGDGESRRTVGQLLGVASADREAVERAAEEEARREHEKRMKSLARQEKKLWQQVTELIENKTPKHYVEALELLSDLSELAEWRGDLDTYAERVRELRLTYRRLSSFTRKLDTAGLP